MVGVTSLVKTDGTGVIQWERNYEESGYYVVLRSVQQSNDGGYVLAGWRIPDGVNNDDFYLIKTDSSGIVEWSQTYGDVSANEMAYDVLQASDGGFVLVGNQFSFSSSWTDGWVVKTDANGNLQWSKTYGEPDPRGDWLYSIQPTNEGGYIMAGCANRDPLRSQETGDFWLLQIDTAGNIRWNRYFNYGTHTSASSVTQTADGSFIAVGDIGTTDTWLIKTNPVDGSILWDKVIEDTGSRANDVIKDAIQTEDRGFAVAAGVISKFMRANPPVATFTYSPQVPTVQQDLFFNASASYDLDDDIETYRWDFADGTIFSTSDSTTMHAFEFPGFYNVSLTVIDSEDLNSTFSHSIVVKITTSISISTESTASYAGQPIEFTGTLRDATGNGLKDANVTISAGTTRGDNWTPIAYSMTDSLGNFLSRWTPSNPSTYSVKAEWIGNTTFYGSTDITNIQILQNPTHLSIALSSTVSSLGLKVGVTGELTSNAIGLAGFPIHLSYSVTAGQTWNDISMILTDAEGQYALEWMPAATGMYIVKASWIGNSSYPRTEVTANLALLSFEDETVFSVASNSTVTGLTFDASNQELRFNVSGLTGTKGYADVSISKTLVDRVTDIQVFVNNDRVTFASTSLDEAWLLHITYTHSTHHITIQISDSSLIGGVFDNLFLILALLAIVVTLVVIAILRSR
jgi:hypothetical protein